MAKINNKAAMFFNLVLMLSFLLVLSMAEGRLFGAQFGKPKPPPTCDTVLAVKTGDTCFDIAESNKLSAEDFGAINPNLNCDALFVGQWLCVAGTA